MKKFYSTTICFCIVLLAIAQPPRVVRTVKLPNGWNITRVGNEISLGDLPLNIAVSSSKKYVAVTNNGQSVQSIQLINPVTEKVIDHYIVPKSWYGLKFSKDEKWLYASGGNDNWILKFSIQNNKLRLADSILLGKKWPTRISPAGIELDEKRKRLYVVTKEDSSFYVVDLNSKKTLHKIHLGAEAYTCILSADGNALYISLWGGGKVLRLHPDRPTELSAINVGNNPNELLLRQNILYVANASDNSVSVIDVTKARVIEVLNAALYPDAPEGSSSNGLALSENGNTLYVANADNNCLAVFDVSTPGMSKSRGFIPTGWYPTNVKVINRKLFVTNGKGFTSFANPRGPNPVRVRNPVGHHAGDTTFNNPNQYIGGLMKGTMSVIPEPAEKQLAAYSKMVYDNTPYSKKGEMQAQGEEGNPIPMKVGAASPIKYVFYIIKENRTYDQVLSDVPGGNGDTSLLLFGEKYTPNQHKLAKEFVLLDNFYVDAEVSADGHNWSTAAHANDYLEKTWPTSYGGRGGKYDGEGKRAIANPKKGFIWDYCKRAGVSYRTYGEFAERGKATIPALEGHFCPYYTGWDESVKDTTRFSQWKREFDSLVALNAVPRFNTVRFINDHTEGLRIGRPTPFAHVADNDWACGLFVEHLSKSPIWKESVVFIIEDDAQNGPDHVDAHRTIAFVAGPFVKRNFVDHTMYSTSSMLRTMELILGLPPMSQYDAAATPMWRSFTAVPNYTAFTSIRPDVDLDEKNTRMTASALLSEQFDFSKEDMAPDVAFNEVIWKAVRGEESVMPAPRRSAFVMISKEEEEEEKEKEKEKEGEEERRKTKTVKPKLKK